MHNLLQFFISILSTSEDIFCPANFQALIYDHCGGTSISRVVGIFSNPPCTLLADAYVGTVMVDVVLGWTNEFEGRRPGDTVIDVINAPRNISDSIVEAWEIRHPSQTPLGDNLASSGPLNM